MINPATEELSVAARQLLIILRPPGCGTRLAGVASHGARAARAGLRRAAEICGRVEEIARLATTEEGKTLAETRIEVGMSDIFEWTPRKGRCAYGRVSTAAVTCTV